MVYLTKPFLKSKKMIIKLTKSQLKEIKEELNRLNEEEKMLRKKQETEHVNGWDFVAIVNQKGVLESMLESKEIDTLSPNY